MWLTNVYDIKMCCINLINNFISILLTIEICFKTKEDITTVSQEEAKTLAQHQESCAEAGTSDDHFQLEQYYQFVQLDLPLELLGKDMSITADWSATLLSWQPGDACIVIKIREIARLGTVQVIHLLYAIFSII